MTATCSTIPSNSILHLEGGKLTFYRGTYSSFERQRREQMALDAKHAKKQDLQRKHLQAFVDRFRAKASKARQAQSRLKLLAKMEPVNALVTDDVRPIVFPEPSKQLSPPIIAIDDVTVGYEPGKPILSDLDLRIDNDERIALLGANGNGKSTFVKLVADRLSAVARHGHARQQHEHRLFRAASARRTRRRRLGLRRRAPADARRAGSEGARARRTDRLSGAEGEHESVEPVGRRESAAPARPCDIFRSASRHSRRADQPSRHRQPRGPDRGDQRLSGRRDPRLA